MYYNDFSQKKLLENGRTFFNKIENNFAGQYWKHKGYKFLGNIENENISVLEEVLEILGYQEYFTTNSLAFGYKEKIVPDNSSLLLKLNYQSEVNLLKFYHLLIVMMAERKEANFYG